MAHIKEPKGVDFIIQSPPLTEQERKEISEFIKNRKAEIKTELLKKSSQKEKSKL